MIYVLSQFPTAYLYLHAPVSPYRLVSSLFAGVSVSQYAFPMSYFYFQTQETASLLFVFLL